MKKKIINCFACPVIHGYASIKAMKHPCDFFKGKIIDTILSRWKFMIAVDWFVVVRLEPTFLRRKRRHQKKKGEMNMVNAREGSKNVQRRTVFTTFPYISSGLVRQRRYSSIVYAKCYWRLAVACTGSIADEARQNRAHWHITSIAFGDDSLLAHVGTNECHKSLRNCQQNQCAIIICFSMASNIDTRCPGVFRVC